MRILTTARLPHPTPRQLIFNFPDLRFAAGVEFSELPGLPSAGFPCALFLAGRR